MTDEKYKELCFFEDDLNKRGYKILGGVDEAGRGPLAGPVVAACVILPSGGPFPRANDSKKLSSAKRDELYKVIMETALSVGVGVVWEDKIDEINILQATYIAMQKAIDDCAVKCDILLVDHVKIPEITIPQFSITHGDALSVSIAAASIIAKVTRDRIMVEMAIKYPDYKFEKNKGYGTAEHYEALMKYGPSPIHRLSFIKKVLMVNE